MSLFVADNCDLTKAERREALKAVPEKLMSRVRTVVDDAVYEYLCGVVSRELPEADAVHVSPKLKSWIARKEKQFGRELKVAVKQIVENIA